MPEDAGQAIADRQAESQAFLAPGRRLIQPLKFVEDPRALFRGDAGAGVPHLDAHLVAEPPRAQQHAALAGVAQRVGEKVLQDPAQQLRVAAHRQRRRRHAQSQATLLGDHRELRLQ